jgi:hypothetical protein
LGRDLEDDDEAVKVTTAFLLIAEGLAELTRIRRLLTPPKET